NGQGSRDADALPLPAGKFMGISPRVAWIQSHLFEQTSDPPGNLRLGSQPVYLEPLGDGVTDRHAGVQRSVRILEDDLHATPQRPKRPMIQREYVLAFKDCLSARRLLQPQDGTADRRLATSRFPHQGQRLPLADLEGNAVYSPHSWSRAAKQP